MIRQDGWRILRLVANVGATVVITVAMACAAATAQVVVKYATPTNGDSVHIGMQLFEKRVEARAPARIDIQIYPGGQLGSIPSMVEGVQLGTIEMMTVPPEFLVGLDTRFGVISAPGIFRDLMHGYRTAYDPEFVGSYWALGANKGITVIGIQCNAQATYLMRRPARTLDDFKGRKLRVFPSAMEREAMRRLAAFPTPMPLGEVIPSLQTGTIDGGKSGMTVWVSFKAHSVAKYLTRTHESLVCPIQFVNKAWFEKLAPEIQRTLIEEARATDEINQKFSIEAEVSAAGEWTANGGELIDLSPADRAELMSRLATVGEVALADDPGAKAMFELMKKVAARL